MMFTNEFYAAAVKDFFQSHVALTKNLNSLTMGCAEDVIALNMRSIKSRIAETTTFTQQLMSAKDQPERMLLTSERWQGRIENMLSLSRQMADAAVTAQGAFSDEVQRHMAEAKRVLDGIMDTTDSNPPAGMKGALGVMESAMNNAQNGVVQLNQVAREATVKLAEVTHAVQESAETQIVGATKNKQIVTVITR
ncbi:phasin family protein [Glaciimonas sp. GG7]